MSIENYESLGTIGNSPVEQLANRLRTKITDDEIRGITRVFEDCMKSMVRAQRHRGEFGHYQPMGIAKINADKLGALAQYLLFANKETRIVQLVSTVSFYYFCLWTDLAKTK